MRKQQHKRGIWRLPLVWRRWAVAFVTVFLTTVVCGLFVPHLFVGPANWVVAVAGVLVLALALFGHFSWLVWMAGFLGWCSRPREVFGAGEPIHTRTALVLPIYHEDPARVAAGIRRTWLSAERAGLAAYCDFCVLSDSIRPEVQAAEEEALADLLPLFSHDAGCFGRLFLIRRADRINYKAGNIANFLKKHGGAYDFMVVLDADSVMSGQRIRQLMLKMQRQPRTAVIQSLMSTFRGATPFG